MSLTLTTAASGVARVAHYVVPTGQTQPIPTLLLEGQRTNRALRSEEANDATWVKTDITVTPNAIAAPDGTMTADLETEGTAGTSSESQSITVTSGAVATYSRYLKKGNTDWVFLRIAAGSLTSGNFVTAWFNLATGTVGTSIASGTSVLAGAGIEAVSNGWYRVWVAGSTSATTTYVVNLRATSGDGSVTRVNNATYYVWGAQLEEGGVPSSYIKTEGTVVTRNADALYFPYTAPPQAMTVYIRGVEMLQGTQPADATLVHFGAASASVDPRCSVYRFAAGNGYRALHDPAAAVTATTAATIERNTLLECRTVLGTNGSVLIGAAKNNGAEVLGPVSSANPFGSAWADTRLWLNSAGVSSTGFFGFTHVVVAKGEQSMDTMRQLAGVV